MKGKPNKTDDLDKEYAALRNSLIPEAERIAKERVKKFGKKWDWRTGVDKKKFKWDRWTQFFHEEMNRLWAETIASSILIKSAETAGTLTPSESESIRQIKASSGFTFAP